LATITEISTLADMPKGNGFDFNNGGAPPITAYISRTQLDETSF
jgi:hypothetical protein